MAALTARQAGLRVALVHEGSEGPRACIGEVVPPSAVQLLNRLAALRYLPSDRYIESFGSRTAWGSDALRPTDFITGALGTGLHVDRHAFNEALVRVAAAEGAHVLAPGRLMTAAREGTAWRLVIRHEARAATLTAAALVDCSGRRAVVARRAGATRHVDDPLVAVVAWLDAFNDSDLDATLIVEAARDGWWYSARVPDRRRIVGFVTNRRPSLASALTAVGWWAEIGRTVHVREVCCAHGYELRQPPIAVTAGSAYLTVVAGDYWVAAGEAAAAVDPISGQGILIALVTGRLAARAIAARLAGDRGHALAEYESGLRRIYDEYLSTRAATYALETRWPLSPFWVDRPRIGRADAAATATR